MIGHRIAHFEIVERLGGGGMGVVYRAHDLKLNRFVALKFISTDSTVDDTSNERFMQEAQTASSLNHPNICTIYEVGQSEEGRLFISMALYEGKTLKELIGGKEYTATDALAVCRQIVDGLGAAHERGIVHRDVKPANILVTDRGRAVILDFGLAKLVGGLALTRTGKTLGTAAYMSPEQARGDPVDEKTDIWSLGAVMYEMLTGKKPFEAPYEQAAIYQIMNTEPAGLDSLREVHGEEIAALVEACLEKDPSRRPSAQTLGEDIAHITDASGTAAVSRARSGRGFFALRPASIKMALATIGILAVAAVAWMVTGRISNLSAPHYRTAAILPLAESPVSQLSVIEMGFTDILSEHLVRLSRTGAVQSAVASYADARHFDINGPVAAYRKFGARSTIVTSLTPLDGPYKITLELVDPLTAAVVDSSVFVATNLKFAMGRALEDLPRLVGSKDRPTGAVVASLPAAVFQEYVTARGHLAVGTELSTRTAVELLAGVRRQAPDFDDARWALLDAYVELFSHTSDSTWLRTALAGEEIFDTTGVSPKLLASLGDMYAKAGQNREAERLYRISLESDSLQTETVYALTQLLESEARFEEAEQLYRRMIELDPGYYRVYVRYGTFLYKRARYQEAAVQFRRQIERAPLNPTGYASLGAMHYYLGSLDEAEAVFLKYPEPDYNLYSNLATLYLYSGNYRKAVRWYEKALAIDPGDPVVWGNLASAYYWIPDEHEKHIESTREAMKRTEALLEADPDDVTLRANLGSYHAQLGDTAASLRYLEPFGDRPASALAGQTVFVIAAAWEELGFREKALQWMRDALDRGYSMTEIERHPGLEDLRRDPRFIALLAEAGQEDT